MTPPNALRKGPEVFDGSNLEDRHFAFLAKLIYQEAGISLSDDRKSLVSSRLAKRVRHYGLDSWDDYIKVLQSSDAREEIDIFVNMMTTNKTEFFREKPHFDFLEQTFLPEMKAKGTNNIMAWIGASSNGQEAYSLAMCFEEFKRQNGGVKPDYRILSTDIDTEVLEFGADGIYPANFVEKQIPPDCVRRYFLKGKGANADKYKINPDVRQKIKFRKHNLVLKSERVPVMFDLIMVRNVLIYFDPPTVELVITKMLDHLNVGGVLILGHCENILKNIWDIEMLAPAVYKKLK